MRSPLHLAGVLVGLAAFLPPSRSSSSSCPNDAHLECPIGSSTDSSGEPTYVQVYRDPSDRCQLPADCPCPYEVQHCNDGTPRYRTPQLGCNFQPCPEDLPPDQQAHAPKVCDIGVAACARTHPEKWVKRDPSNKCHFMHCGEGNWYVDAKDACPMWLCVDEGRGWVQYGDPQHACKPDCESTEPPPPPEAAPPDTTQQPPQSTADDWPPSLPPEGETLLGKCDGEVRKCPHGHYVGRDPLQNCEFTPCDLAGQMEADSDCPGEGKKFVVCFGGYKLYADVENGCEVPNCPEDEKVEGEDEQAVQEAPDGEDQDQGHTDQAIIACKDAVQQFVVCRGGAKLYPDPQDECRIPACPEDEALEEEDEQAVQEALADQNDPQEDQDPCKDAPQQFVVCHGGSKLYPDPNDGCRVPSCPEDEALEEEDEKAVQAALVGDEDPCRDAPQQFEVCRGGVKLYPDPNDGCRIPSCPEDEALEEEDEKAVQEALEQADQNSQEKDDQEDTYNWQEHGENQEESENDAEIHEYDPLHSSRHPHEGKHGTQDVRCERDKFLCKDGTYVRRDPNRGCHFRECPPEISAGDDGHPGTYPKKESGDAAEESQGFSNTNEGDTSGGWDLHPEGPSASGEQHRPPQPAADEDHEPCSTLLPTQDKPYSHDPNDPEGRRRARMHSICDKYCNADDCTSVLDPFTERRNRRRLLRAPTAGGRRRRRRLKDMRETCTMLKEMFRSESATGTEELNCSIH